MKDLLKILNMSEDEQEKWLIEKAYKIPGVSLADLAFRLRNETMKQYEFWHSGEYAVQEYLIENGRPCIRIVWPTKPIQWIIAALIAKKLKGVTI